jgi:hypothetical protein
MNRRDGGKKTNWFSVAAEVALGVLIVAILLATLLPALIYRR